MSGVGSVDEGLEIILRNSNEEKPKVVIDAAHVYTHEEPCETHSKCAREGAFYADVFESIGYDVKKLLFVDDYNPKIDGKEENLNINDYISFISQEGYNPDAVFYESSMKEESENLLQKLRESKEIYEDDRNSWLYKGNVFLKEDGLYKCSLLDAAFSVKKFEMADVGFNFLPASSDSKRQQKNVKRILQSAGYDAGSLISHYVGKEEEANFANYKDELCQLKNVLSTLRSFKKNVYADFSKPGGYS